jgi:uncharacterized protein (TIGR02284 family)
MAQENDKVISILNELIETCRDGENGFRVASEDAKDPDLKSLFTRYSQQRAQFASDLQTAVHQRGGQPARAGSVAGALHRGWINVKSTVAERTDQAIIAECERGEDSAVESYKKALASDLLPLDLRTLVQEQYTGVKEAHDQVRSLERGGEAW